jgi:uncharacterized 2Fe-2S/4Fe-4S cluster protein (DUF4445 family)
LPLALDLGTTTLAGRLLADDGAVLAEARTANPQRALGADILTRLQRADAGAAAELQQLLVDGIRSLIADLLAGAGRPASSISAAAAAGNPGISHLLCRLPAKPLLFPPHRTALTELTELTAAAADLGLAVPLQLFPAVSGFVGGDLVAVLFGGLGAGNSGLEGSNQQRIFSRQPPAPSLVLDLGTNAELALWTGTQWWVSSAAAGPAFEAGNIRCGMPLAPGAVTDVHHRADRLELIVAGGGRPSGLCGSGLLALLAAARAGGLLTADGRIVAPDEIDTNLARYLVPDGAGWAICCHRDARGEIRLTQADVRHFQLAKGAVRAGVEVLLERSGLTAGAIAAVMVTGAFGAALPVAALRGVAMLPEGMIDKLFTVPNGVLDGLAAFLADPRGTERLAALQGTIKAFPLSGTPAFERRFLAALDF